MHGTNCIVDNAYWASFPSLLHAIYMYSAKTHRLFFALALLNKSVKSEKLPDEQRYEISATTVLFHAAVQSARALY